MMKGYGELHLTDKALIWNKGALTYIAFGAMGALSEDFVAIPLDNIAEVGKYLYIGGGGLSLTDKQGKTHKISFGKKKDFKLVFDYLSELVEKRV